ncbi:MAG: extracellular solute-binding protein [Faecalibacterium sp.]
MKKIARRNFLTLMGMGSVAAAATMAGCSTESSTTTTSVATSSQTTDTAEEESLSGEIEVLFHKVEIVELMEDLSAQFTAIHPDVKVVINSSGDVLQTRAVSGNMPDIYTCAYNADPFVYVDDGYFADLTGLSCMENVLESVVEENLYNGANYYVPYISNATGVYYNTEIFAENNILLPETMDEFFDVCETLLALGIMPISFSDQELWTLSAVGDRLTGLVYDDDGSLFEEIAAGTTSALEHDGMRTVAEIFLKMRDYGRSDSLGVSYEAAISEFAWGQTAMMIQGTWMLALCKAANPDVPVDMFPLPGITAAETRVGTNVDLCYFVGEDSANKDVAIAFLAWMNETEQAQYFADYEGSPSLIKDVESSTAEFESLANLIEEGKNFKISRNYWAAGFISEFNNCLQRLLANKDVDTYLSEIDESVDLIYNA